MPLESPIQFDADVLVVGAGPAGLAAAIALRRAAPALRVMVLEKARAVGGHLLSGAIVDLGPFRDLLPPDALAALPVAATVVRDTYRFLFPGRGSLRLPYVPPPMRDAGLALVDLPELARALAATAETLGVDVLPAQPADALVFQKTGDATAPDDSLLLGVRTGADLLTARHVVLAEGPGGPLAADVRGRFPALRAAQPASHALAIRELWAVPPRPDLVGTVAHTFGAPLGLRTYGGGFLYRLAPDRVVAGLAVALDAPMPPGPQVLFEQWRRHRFVASWLRGGNRIGYGSRLIPEGGWPAIPDALQAANVTLLGDAAALVDPLALKGIQLDVQAALAAAARLAEAAARAPAGTPLVPPNPLRRDDLPFATALRQVRNHRAGFEHGLIPGLACAALGFLSGGRLPPRQLALRGDLPPPARPDTFVLPTHHAALESALADARLAAPRPGTAPHITLHDPALCDGCPHPCYHFCPAATYAPAPEGTLPLSAPPLVHAENCLHCHTCLLRCPRANIRWTPPAPPAGPNYAAPLSGVASR